LFYIYKPIIKKELIGRSAPSASKIDQVKKELRSLTSLHGFSNVLNTSNPFVKGLWLCFVLVLFSFLLQNVQENMSEYYQYTVITKIESLNESPMTLPAVTLCLTSLKGSFLPINATLDSYLYNCFIFQTECGFKDFYYFRTRLRMNITNKEVICYVLNGGRNSTGHSKEIISTNTTGPDSGIDLRFYLPKDHILFYYISDSYVQPTSFEIVKFGLPGTTETLRLEKTVETKLEFPFNNCWNRINLPDSHLVRKLSETNISYRQLNCFELCQNHSLLHELSKDEVNKCNQACPLECESTQYRISETKFSLADFSDRDEYSLKWTPVIKKKLNISVNSTEEFEKNNLRLKILFDSLKYTKISQTPKTTLSALVSNLGGSSGLFLDLSFMSACRAIEFILGIIFKI